MLRFLLSFAALQLGLFAVYLLNTVQSQLVLPWTATLASLCVALVTGVDPTAAAVGKVLWNTQTGFGVSIEPGCNGLEASIVFLSAVLAFPARWRDKAAGLALGLLAVQALNVIRVISLYYLGQWSTTLFDIAHQYLWQALIMLDVLLVWLVWVRRIARPVDVSGTAAT